MLTKDRIEEVVNGVLNIPATKLEPPKEILKLNGLLQYPDGKYVLGRTYFYPRKVILLSHVSDEVNLIHEMLHYNGYGEVGARVGARIIDFRRRMVGKPQKIVQYDEQYIQSADELLRQLNIAQEIASANANGVIRYIITG